MLTPYGLQRNLRNVLLLDFNLLLFKKFHLRLFTFLLKNFMLPKNINFKN